MLTLQEVETRVKELAEKIDAPAESFPTFGISRHDGTPNIEIERDTYYYLAYDRDIVTLNLQTTMLPKLLYWIFKDITFQMAMYYELANRNPNLDCRRLIFRHQLELLEKIQPQWKDLSEQEIKEILEVHPYVDKTKPQ